MADNLTKEQRSYCMARVRVRGTALELAMRSELLKRGLKFRRNVRTLPGKPDVVFPIVKVAVFLDGDFWHGYRFPIWRRAVAKFWREKIAKNRDRDRRNFAKLRRMGWRVLRIWQHQIRRDLSSCADRIVSEHSAAVDAARPARHQESQQTLVKGTPIRRLPGSSQTT